MKQLTGTRKILKMHLSLIPRLLLFLYAYIFASTEILSYSKAISRIYILPLDMIFIFGLFYIYRNEFLELLSIRIKSRVYYPVIFLFILTFIQGIFSAPSTTDSMVYHIPKVMYWIQEETLFQDVIRNSHDFMAPFGEYILLHLYLITDSDRLLFFSQWLAYVMTVFLSVLIVKKFLTDKINEAYVAITAATLPIAVLQSSSTQTDLITTVFVLLSTYYAFCFRKSPYIKNSIALGLSIGLGILTKASFVIYMIIPLGIVALSLVEHRKRIASFVKPFFIIGLIILILQLRFIFQNLSLFGNFSGQPLLEKGSGYTNEFISPPVLVSNVVRNSFLNIPIPIFNSDIQKLVYLFHQVIGIDTNDSGTTYSGTSFKILPVLFPQEDIAANPLHLILILVAAVYLFVRKKGLQNANSKALLTLSIVSFLLFSLILKWQPFHPRLQIPFLLIGSITGYVILEDFFISKKLMKGFLTILILLAFTLVVFNVGRPFISYNVFYNYVSGYSQTNASVPQSFFMKPREKQYFNSRFYWYTPYEKITQELKLTNSDKVTFNLMDEFEYPFWILLKNNDIQSEIIPYSKASSDAAIISTSTEPFKKEGYKTNCVKSEIDYGYACLSIK